MGRKRTLIAGADVRIELSAFARGERQAWHTDEHSRITATLSGGFQEETVRASADFAAGDVLLKSHHAGHADQFGARGARLASIVFLDDSTFTASGLDGAWHPRGAGSFALMLTALEAACANDHAAASAIAHDLLGDADFERRPDAPLWLHQLKQELEQVSLAAIDITMRARQAGVHPAHLSRLFRRCFGVSMTGHALRHSVRRALDLIPHTSLGEVALNAGFYDQSHMNRVFRRLTGRTPGAYRDLLASVG